MLTFFGGKGGVGKTTCAAAWGLARAAARRRVLVLSTDPAHSLADAFATPLRKNRVTAIRPRLAARELEPAAAVKRWLSTRRPALAQLLERGTLLDREDVEQALSLPVPGLDELAGFLAVSDLMNGGEYDEIVVDTAPTGHTLRLLEIGKVLSGFTGLLQAMHERHAMVVHALGGEIGASELVEDLRQNAAMVDDHLHDRARTQMVWVTIAEPVAVAETLRAIDWLLERGFPLTSVFINRLVSESPSRNPRRCRECEARVAFERAAIIPIASALHDMRPGVTVRTLPDYDQEPRGLRALGRVGQRMIAQPPRTGVADGAPARVVRLWPRDSAAEGAALALAASRLVFFGGKGGVGKTTCATSTALAIAAAYPRRRIRLLSTDPAPSLGDVLSMHVGDRWTPVRTRGSLDVRELDAAAAFDEYRSRYEAAAEAFFDSLRGDSSFDAVADRAVFARLFELAPPGVDELVALVTVIDVLEEDPDSLVIVDTAPTGHALRLLSSQGDLRNWLDLLMRVLVKYQLSARAETFTRQVVNLSRGLRRLHERLSDSAAAKFVAVTRPGALSRLETFRMIAQLRRLRVQTPMLIVNAGTEGTCRGCRARAQAEARELRELARACGRRSRRCDIIHAPLQLPPPRGVRELRQWSSAWRSDRGRDNG
jgi:arsenite-transporting ATPase